MTTVAREGELPRKRNAVEAFDAVKAYVRQELLAPLVGVPRWLALGLLGSVGVTVGVLLLTMALLRALQTETGTVFKDNLSWVPYAISAVALTSFGGCADAAGEQTESVMTSLGGFWRADHARLIGGGVPRSAERCGSSSSIPVGEGRLRSRWTRGGFDRFGLLGGQTSGSQAFHDCGSPPYLRSISGMCIHSG